MSKAVSDTSPAVASKKKPGPRKGARKAMRVTHAQRASHETNGHAPDLIAVPRTGPGKRRMVERDSFEGLCVTLAEQVAAEIAPRIVDQCKSVAERLVRARLATVLGKL